VFGKRSRRTIRDLEDHGTPAPATILEIAEKGMAVTSGADTIVANTEVVLKTRLRIEPVGAPTFEVEQRFRYPQLSVPSQGSRISVVFDPDDHDKVMVDREALPLLSADVLARAGSKGSMLGGILDVAQAARRDHPGDPDALADAVRSSLGVPNGPDMSVFSGSALAAFGQPPAVDPIGSLERLVALRDAGVLTPEEFATQKAAVLARSDP
jgi:hypothetical protein